MHRGDAKEIAIEDASLGTADRSLQATAHAETYRVTEIVRSLTTRLQENSGLRCWKRVSGQLAKHSSFDRMYLSVQGRSNYIYPPANFKGASCKGSFVLRMREKI